jgi:hypothetical protein
VLTEELPEELSEQLIVGVPSEMHPRNAELPWFQM